MQVRAGPMLVPLEKEARPNDFGEAKGGQALNQFDRLTREAIDQNLFRGSVIRVEREGNLLFEQAWGYALYTGSEHIPMDTKHLFDLASLSKLCTATAILHLITLKELQLDTPILDVVPYKNPVLLAALKRIDVASLLDHSSGIHYWYPLYTRSGDSFETILSSIIEQHPLSEGMIYSDLNFMLLGFVLERLTGKVLSKAMSDLVFLPLGLENATYHPEPSSTVATEFGNRIERQMVSALGLEFPLWRDEANPIKGFADDGNCHYFFNGEAGHAGIFANARDVSRLGNIYLENSFAESVGYLNPALRRAATTNRGSDRGLGFQFGRNYPRNGFGHTGFTGTYLHINPDTGLTITILTNRLHVNNPQNITRYRCEISEEAMNVFK